MKSVTLNAFPRTLSRRQGAKRVRGAGRIPAVVYGHKSETQNLEVDAKAVSDLMQHHTSESLLVDLQVKDDARPSRLALVQEVQHHPLSGRVVHVDFHEVSEDEKVTVNVPVETVGEAVGVKTGGGVLEHVMFKIKVRALPKDLPEQITIDVSGLEANRAIHLGEVQAPAGVEILGHKELVVVACAAPRVEAEVTEEVEAAPAVAGEVEMIKEKKEEGEAPEKGGKAEKAEKPEKK